MTAIKYTTKLATTTCITQTGYPAEVVVPAFQFTPLDGKVYRLLRPDERAQFGISAKSKFSDVTAAYHVALGSSIDRKDSKYISTCLNFNDALLISTKNRFLNGDIVSINVDNAPLTVIHVWNAEVRKQINIEQQVTDTDIKNKFETFAEYFNEVILVGDVPANCMQIETYKQFLPNFFGNIVCSI